MGDEGSDYASHAEVRYENCHVPQSNLLGREGEGFTIAQERLGPGRIHHCMRWIGICERAFDLMCNYAAHRELSAGVLLGSRQNVQEWIAESRAEINAARLLVLRTAAAIDREGAASVREDISLIKFFVAGIMQKVLDRAIQVHGALGLTDATLLPYWYRHERAARIYDGPDEVHKVVVARSVLRRYGVELYEAEPNHWSYISFDINHMTNDLLIDKSRPVRDGEDLPNERLLSYLRKHIPELEGSLTGEQFPAGFSNLTYLLRVGARELVLRRPPIGAKIKTAHDMGREYRILSHLHPVYKKVPPPFLFCEDESVLGAPFYVMERVKGVILRAQPPEGLDLSAEMIKRLSEAFIENLAEIHEVDYAAAGLGDLGSPQGYVTRQVEGWTRRYYNARTDEVPAIEQLASWLIQHVPPDSSRSALLHNDYKYDNLVLSSDDLSQVVAVLDWEMATIGDPLMDFGTTLGYWVELTDPEEWQHYGFVLTKLPGNFTRSELVDYYSRRTGREIRDPVFYYAYGLLKIAVIVQQIYFRYQKGLTRDPRFAQLDRLVKACGRLAQQAVAYNRIDRLG